MRISKKYLSLFLCAVMMFSFAPIAESILPGADGNIVAQAAVRINKKSVKLLQGKTVRLKVKGTKKKIKWSSSNKKIATVNKKGKVTAKKAGKAVITAKVGKKKYKCTVKVIKRYDESGEWKGTVNETTYYFCVNPYTSVDNSALGVVYIYKNNTNGKELVSGEYFEYGFNKYRMQLDGGVIEFTVNGNSMKIEQMSGKVNGVLINGQFTLSQRYNGG